MRGLLYRSCSNAIANEADIRSGDRPYLVTHVKTVYLGDRKR